MEQITAIGFDLFDTLITLENLGFKDVMDRLAHCLGKEGLPVTEEVFLPIYRETASDFMSRARDEGKETHNRFWVSTALHRLGHHVEPDDARVTRAVDAYFTAFLDHAVLLPKTLQTLQTLKRHYQLGLLSNFTHAPLVYELVQRFGLGDLLEIQLVSGDLGYRKPKRVVFDTLAEQFGVPHEQIAFVGDNVQADIEGAKEAGFWPIHTIYAQHYKAMQAGHTEIIPSKDDPDPPSWSRLTSRGQEQSNTATGTHDRDVTIIQSWDDLLGLFRLL